jgi:hypothetical protein
LFDVTGTATLDADYSVSGPVTFTATGGTIQFAADQSTVEFQLTVADDELKERLESLKLQLLPAAGYGVGTGTLNFTIDSAELAGDFNDDQVVDGADFLQWQLALGEPADPAGSGADGDYDGDVDGADMLDVWATNFGDQDVAAPPASALFVEPNAGALALGDAADSLTGLAGITSSAMLSLLADESGEAVAARRPRVEAVDEAISSIDWATAVALLRRWEGDGTLAAEKPSSSESGEDASDRAILPTL